MPAIIIPSFKFLMMVDHEWTIIHLIHSAVLYCILWFILCPQQAFLTGIPIVAVVRDNPRAFYIVLTFVIFLLCMVVLLLIFLPKYMMQRRYARKSRADQRKLLKMALSVRKSSDDNLPGSSPEARSGSDLVLDAADSSRSKKNPIACLHLSGSVDAPEGSKSGSNKDDDHNPISYIMPPLTESAQSYNNAQSTGEQPSPPGSILVTVASPHKDERTSETDQQQQSSTGHDVEECIPSSIAGQRKARDNDDQNSPDVVMTTATALFRQILSLSESEGEGGEKSRNSSIGNESPSKVVENFLNMVDRSALSQVELTILDDGILLLQSVVTA